MDVSEYVDAVTGQMRCKRARDMVAKELSDHINDQIEDYVKSGMEPECAELEAVRQMGDAVEVGTEMDRLHRPRMDKRVLGIVAVFSIVAMFLQTMIVLAIRIVGGVDSVSSKMVPVQVLLGVLIMVGILYLDYTILGKYPLVLWIVLLCLPLVGNATELYVFNDRVFMYALMGLMIPAYGGVVYHYRKKGWLGLLCSMLWLMAGGFIYYRMMNRAFLVLIVCFAGALLLSYALAKGWYGISPIGSLAVLWGLLFGGLLVIFVYASHYGGYIIARIEGFINYAADSAGNGYITDFMKDGLGDLALWQPMEEWIYLWGESGRPVESALTFFMILKEMGVMPAVLILLGFAVLFICMAAGVSKQKNVLGSLLGMACVLALLIPTVGHVLSNLALIPYTDIYIPFLYPGWVVNAISYTLLGLYLSVYRNTDVVA